MKYSIYLLPIAIFLLWYTQKNSSEEHVPAKQTITREDTTKTEGTLPSVVEQDLRATAQVKKPSTAIVKKVIEKAIIATQSKIPMQEKIPEETEKKLEEDSNIQMYEEEEQDTTPPPPKSQEELDDEAKADSIEAPIAEEDSDEIGLNKPANELEDEAGNTVDEEIIDEDASLAK